MNKEIELMERERMTVREPGESAGLSSTSSVFIHLKALERKGYITRISAFPGTITIL